MDSHLDHINKTVMNKELQDMSRVCMKKERQWDGSQKNLNIVIPSCVKSLNNLITQKTDIEGGK